MIPKIQKMIYATDLSPNSVFALRHALNSAVKHEADITILHVFEKVDPATNVMMNPYLYEEKHQKILNEHISEAKNSIENRLRALRDQELAGRPEFAGKEISIEVCEGFPAEKILSRAHELNCDEIIMGTHSKGIIANTFLGSTAKRVLRRTRIPVLIIPLPREGADAA